MSELHIPPEVADAIRALRPELRRKLSLRDIDDMTRPFRQRIAALEEDLERERMRLAACSTAALGYFDTCHDDYRSAALDDVLALRNCATALEAFVTAFDAWRPEWEHGPVNRKAWIVMMEIRENLDRDR